LPVRFMQPGLERLFAGQPAAFILLPPGTTSQDLVPVLRWLSGEGVLRCVAEPQILAELRPDVQTFGRPFYLSQGLPSSTSPTAAQPTVLVQLKSPNWPPWRQFWQARRKPAAPTVVLVEESEADPQDSRRVARDLMAPATVLTLDQWMERYLE
jgi:hypothetical protein